MTKTISILNKVVETTLIVVFAVMVCSVVWQVVSRFVLGDASSFTEELARFCLIWLTILGAAYMVGLKSHIAMDLMYQKASEATRRKMMVFVYVIVALFALIVLLIGGGNLVYISLRLGQVSSALGVPLGVVYGIVPISGALMLVYTAHNWKEESRS